MTIEGVTGHPELRYHLISYDKKGRERDDDTDAAASGGLLSEVVRETLRREPVTDVFFLSHGWKGDVPAAIDQYDRWIGAMASCQQDRARIRAVRPGFRPLLVGLHWPSRPWGDEDQDDEPLSFDAGDADRALDRLVDDAADKTADSERARDALRTVFRSALDDMEPATLPPEVRRAYEVLAEEMGLVAAGAGAAPGDEGEAFDPEARYQLGLEEESGVPFGVFGAAKGGVLSVLRQLSFWKMKARARSFGESGAATLLRQIQRDTAGRDLKLHLMGHSFGCIVVSAAIAGANGDQPLERPVDSVLLAQGALSYWAYCSDIPVAPGKAGYFHSIAAKAKVRGPLVTTQSEHDTAVGRLYPLAAGLRHQIAFAPDDPPKYGALGTFGARGPGVAIEDLEMLPLDRDYALDNGRIYNLESSGFINRGGGASGAHNDIDKPEVGHAFWAAVLRASGG